MLLIVSQDLKKYPHEVAKEMTIDQMVIYYEFLALQKEEASNAGRS